MNTVILIGNLTKDPELSYTPNNQTAVCRFTLAVNRPRRNGEDQGADYIRITVWGNQAENCNRYLSRGRKAAVHGRIVTGSYKDRNGQTVYTTDVTADNVEFLSSQGNNSASEARNAGNRPLQPQQQSFAPQGQSFAQQQSLVQQAGWDLPDSFSAAEDDIPF